MATTNDKEFKSRLETLSISQQRQVAALFVQRVFAFSNDVRIKAALDMAMRADISDAELAVVCGKVGLSLAIDKLLALPPVADQLFD